MLRSRNIGLFPGSFNPPHIGHIDLAKKSILHAHLDLCVFYVNSFNAAKRDVMIPLRNRLDMLRTLIPDDRMVVLDPQVFSDNPGNAYLSQEKVFTPIIQKLGDCLGEPATVWLVRGSDNFLSPEQGGYIYPEELRSIPHVIGIRNVEHSQLDYSCLRRSLLVFTKTGSSSWVRQNTNDTDGLISLIGEANYDYMHSNQLFAR